MLWTGTSWVLNEGVALSTKNTIQTYQGTVTTLEQKLADGDESVCIELERTKALLAQLLADQLELPKMIAAMNNDLPRTPSVKTSSSYEAMQHQRNMHHRMAAMQSTRPENDEPKVKLPAGWEKERYFLSMVPKEDWERDESVVCCHACKVAFARAGTVSSGRHHCRTCGRVFCQQCVPPVGINGFLAGEGKVFRACGKCVQKALATKRKEAAAAEEKFARLAAESKELNPSLVLRKKCLVEGCEAGHTKHFCKYCQNPDSSHFSDDCFTKGKRIEVEK